MAQPSVFTYWCRGVLKASILLSYSRFTRPLSPHHPLTQMWLWGGVRMTGSPFAASPPWIHAEPLSPLSTAVGTSHFPRTTTAHGRPLSECSAAWQCTCHEQMDVSLNHQRLHTAVHRSSTEAQRSVINYVNISKTGSDFTNLIRGAPDERHDFQGPSRRGSNPFYSHFFLVPKKTGCSRPILTLSSFNKHIME